MLYFGLFRLYDMNLSDDVFEKFLIGNMFLNMFCSLMVSLFVCGACGCWCCGVLLILGK